MAGKVQDCQSSLEWWKGILETLYEHKQGENKSNGYRRGKVCQLDGNSIEHIHNYKYLW